jgi:hypothetical protein
MFSFRLFCENEVNQYTSLLSAPGVVKVLSNPNVKSNSEIEFGGNYLLKPKEMAYYIIPQQFHNKLIREMVLSHRKGPHGHGEPHMSYEDAKKKWRDYYGSYSRIEAHDATSNQWVSYKVSGRDYKHAALTNSGGYEVETLHDWLLSGKVRPDLLRISNPGNMRVGQTPTNPTTGEKIDPYDVRSTVEIGPLRIFFFMEKAFGAKKYIQHVYSPQGFYSGQFGNTRFANTNSQSKAEVLPVYGTYGIGYYPGALYLDPATKGRYLKPIGYANQEVHKHIKIKHGDAVQPEHMFIPGDKWAVVAHGTPLFSVKRDATEGSGDAVNVYSPSASIIAVEMPQYTFNKKLIQVEVMCGDTYARPDKAVGKEGDTTGDERNKVIRGPAVMTIYLVKTNGGRIQLSRNDVAPQMVITAYPNQEYDTIEPGDKIEMAATGGVAFVMAWRISYSEEKNAS